MDVTLSPEFLRLTLKVQEALGKSTYRNDSNHIDGMFAINDMLDILGKEIDKERES